MQKKLSLACVAMLDIHPSVACERCKIQTALQVMLDVRGQDTWLPLDGPRMQSMLNLLEINDTTDCDESHARLAIHNEPRCIFVTKKQKIGMAIIKNLFNFCKSMNFTNALLITKHKMTSFAQQSAVELSKSSPVTITCMLWGDVLFNPLDHHLSPSYKVVSKAYVLQKHPSIGTLRLSEIPKIRSGDPVVKYMGCSCGQILCIVRTDGEETFRVVVG